MVGEVSVSASAAHATGAETSVNMAKAPAVARAAKPHFMTLLPVGLSIGRHSFVPPSSRGGLDLIIFAPQAAAHDQSGPGQRRIRPDSCLVPQPMIVD